MKLSHAITGKNGDSVVPQGRKITNSLFREIQKVKIEQVEVASNDLEGAYVAADVIDMSTGEVLIEANHELTSTAIAKLVDAGIQNFEIFFPDRDDAGNVISATLRKDAVKSQNDALHANTISPAWAV
jgi:DNA-directed RNA polymerase subunit beta